MTDSRHFDAIIIGAGQAGGPLSTALAGDGRTVALIEQAAVGGTCINYGCTPTKTMVGSARVAYLARRAGDYGINVSGLAIDQTVIRKRKRDIVEQFRAGSERAITGAAGVELIYGEATFTGPRRVRVTGQVGATMDLAADLIFINTGARTMIPTIPGIDVVPYLDSTSIMELDATPEHLIVLGGGYIGLEFGQMFRRFGSEVTIVHRGRQLLDREDEDIARGIEEILIDDGIKVRLRSEAIAVEPGDDGVVVTVRPDGAESTVSGSHLLVAIGRTPNSDRLNLSAAEVDVDERGFIAVNERLETSAKGVYALGDVKGGPAFTHISYDDFRVVRDNILHEGSRTTDDRLAPYVVFTDPELGRVGLTEREAKERSIRYRKATMPMANVARAIETAETRGFMKVLVDQDTDLIIGAAVLGVWGGEIMSQIQLAMMGGITCSQLADAVFAHPTFAESINNLVSRLDG